MDLHPRCLQGSQGGLPSSSGALYVDIHRFHPLVHSLLCGSRCSQLGGKRCSLARPLEALRTPTGPRNSIPLVIGEGYNGVVEGSMDVDDPRRDIQFCLFPGKDPAAAAESYGSLPAFVLSDGLFPQSVFPLYDYLICLYVFLIR